MSPTTPAEPRKRAVGRVVLFRALALSLGLGLALIVVEIGLRLFSLAPSAAISTVTEREFRRVPGMFGPGQSIVDRQNAALPFSVRIDSLGFRGADFPRRKQPGELRLLSVGDSFTYGDFVNDDATLPFVVQQRLSQSCSRRVTVINGGVGGSTITTAAPMVDRAWGTSPDVVMLVFSENDIDDLRSNMWQELAVNRNAKSRFPLSVVYPVLRRLAVWNFALKQRGRVRALGVKPLFASSPRPAAPKSDVDSLRAEYARRLHELAQDVRAHGRAFVLVAYPSHLTVNGTVSDDQLHWLERVAADEGVPMLDLLGTLRDTHLPMDSLYLLPYDGHPSPRGYQLAGAAVTSKLVQMGVCGA